MRAITLWQPWAWAVIHAGKDVENRPRNMGYVGEIAIHVGLNWDDFRVRSDLEQVDRAIALSARPCARKALPSDMRRFCGRIIGTVEIVRWERFPFTKQLDLGRLPDSSPWAFGPWCALLRNARPIANPVAVRGYQGTWTVPEDVERQVRAQLGRAA